MPFCFQHLITCCGKHAISLQIWLKSNDNQTVFFCLGFIISRIDSALLKTNCNGNPIDLSANGYSLIWNLSAIRCVWTGHYWRSIEILHRIICALLLFWLGLNFCPLLLLTVATDAMSFYVLSQMIATHEPFQTYTTFKTLFTFFPNQMKRQ